MLRSGLRGDIGNSIRQIGGTARAVVVLHLLANSLQESLEAQKQVPPLTAGLEEGRGKHVSRIGLAGAFAGTPSRYARLKQHPLSVSDVARASLSSHAASASFGPFLFSSWGGF